MTTVSTPVDSDLAQVYNNASPQDRQKLQTLLSLWLREMGSLENKPLNTLMDEISDRAQERGLTPAILESLLKEDK